MSDQNDNTDDLAARFHMDQAAASEDEQTREQIVWSQRVRDAETTLNQRDALTRRLNGQAAFLEVLNLMLWLALVVGYFVALGAGIAYLIGLFR